jgi:hypothetical protein
LPGRYGALQEGCRVGSGERPDAVGLRSGEEGREIFTLREEGPRFAQPIVREAGTGFPVPERHQGPRERGRVGPAPFVRRRVALGLERGRSRLEELLGTTGGLRVELRGSGPFASVPCVEGAEEMDGPLRIVVQKGGDIVEANLHGRARRLEPVGCGCAR